MPDSSPMVKTATLLSVLNVLLVPTWIDNPERGFLTALAVNVFVLHCFHDLGQHRRPRVISLFFSAEPWRDTEFNRLVGKIANGGGFFYDSVISSCEELLSRI